MEQISIVIAEDLQLLREVWCQLLGEDPRFKIVGLCDSGEKAIELVDSLTPRLLITDINMKGMDGFELTQIVRQKYPSILVLAVSMHVQISFVRRIMTLGANGYVTKNSSISELLKAVTELCEGRRYICEEIKQKIAAELSEDAYPLIKSLTKREMEILHSVKKGLSSAEIGNLLNISPKTVEAHRYNILKKLKMKNTAGAITLLHTSG